MDVGDDLNPVNMKKDEVDARIKSNPIHYPAAISERDTPDKAFPTAPNSSQSNVLLKPNSAPKNVNKSGPLAAEKKRQFVFSNSEGHMAPDYAYPMRGRHRGICLVLTVDQFDPEVKLPDRQGSNIDAKNIERVFTQLQFRCYFTRNPTRRDLRQIIREIAKQDHSQADCFACVILSHGEDGGIIYARDGKVKLDEILDPFKGDVCPTLLGKPKLFFVQACRGTKLIEGVVMADGHGPGADDYDGVENSFKRIPAEADFLLAFAVPPGFYAWRNSAKGSWFVQALAVMLERYGTSLDLLSILTRVSHKVAFDFESNASDPSMSQKKQIPCIVSMLTKDVFFRPKSA